MAEGPAGAPPAQFAIGRAKASSMRAVAPITTVVYRNAVPFVSAPSPAPAGRSWASCRRCGGCSAARPWCTTCWAPWMRSRGRSARSTARPGAACPRVGAGPAAARAVHADPAACWPLVWRCACGGNHLLSGGEEGQAAGAHTSWAMAFIQH